jgi:hypothetical protein
MATKLKIEKVGMNFKKKSSSLKLLSQSQPNEEKISFKFHPLFSIFSLVAILVGSRDHRTQFWKGAIQGPFHQTLVTIGAVVRVTRRVPLVIPELFTLPEHLSSPWFLVGFVLLYLLFAV